MAQPLTLHDHILGLERFDADEQRFKDAVHARLLARTEIDFATGCHIYTGAWEKSGLARMRVGRRVYNVPRVAAWLYIRGFHLWDIRRAAHRPSCPHPACYAREHLIVLADQAEALAAQMRCGRLGEHRRRLNKEKARYIRALAAEGVPLEAIAAMPEIGCRPRAVQAVVEGGTWRDD